GGLQRRWPTVSGVCGGLQRALHHPVGAYLFLTPAAAQAFAPHYDPHDTFMLQIDGAKDWRVYDSVVTLPLPEMRQPIQPEQLGEPILEVRLEAGDLLYIPRGFAHQGLTADEPSLHLTLAV